MNTITRAALAAVLAGAWTLTGCGDPELETRTFDVQYLSPHEVGDIIGPYVFTDREGRPGRLSTAEGAVTVRETEDNLDEIARVLERYDRPRPSIMLHFQIIEANGAARPDPAIADVERELRRLFRFEGYELVEETQLGGIQGTGFRQMVGSQEGPTMFYIEGGVSEVRLGGETPTVTVDVGLSATNIGRALETTVTIPVGHSVVLGTARAPTYDGALILVVRAEIMGGGPAAAGDSAAGDGTGEGAP